MIAVSSSSRNFAALGKYLVVGRDKVEEGRVAWTSARNLPTDDPELAAKIMRATAAQNVRVSQPVYHLALSFDPRDVVDRKTMECVADRVLEELKLKEHQAVIVAHGDRAHSHVHILVNRVHPENGRVWDRWQDYPTIQRVLREEERALGVRVVQGTLESRPALKGNEIASVREQQTQERSETGRAAGRVAEHEALYADIEAYVRVSEMAQQRHAAERDVSAARASLETTILAIERASRAEAAFDEALRRGYRDPAAAKAEFLRAAEEHGLAEASRLMREKPERYGELSADTSSRRFLRPAASTEIARSAAREGPALGAEVVAAQREIFKSPQTGVEAVDRQVSLPTAAGVRAAGQARLNEARSRVAAIAKDEGAMPSRSQLEGRLAAGLQRLTPPEFDRLRRTLSGQQFNVALKLRQMIRDAALGRDGEA